MDVVTQSEIVNATHAPKLHVIVARDKPVAVVLHRRRRQTASFLWNTSTDEVNLGQWIKNRIYELKSSISPDGKYFLYSVYEGRLNRDVQGTYAAISLAPYLKAIDLYQDMESRGGGGFFINNRQYKLNDIFYKEEKFYIRSGYLECINRPDEHCLIGSAGLYVMRLKDLGWVLESQARPAEGHRISRFTKQISRKITLVKILHSQFPNLEGKTSDWEEHEIRNTSGSSLSKHDWEWADIVGSRVCWMESGFLKSGVWGNNLEPKSEQIIHDFNDYHFEEITAPY